MKATKQSPHRPLAKLANSINIILFTFIGAPALSGGLAWKPIDTKQTAPRWREAPLPSADAAKPHQSLNWTSTSLPTTNADQGLNGSPPNLNHNTHGLTGAVSSERNQETGDREQLTETKQSSNAARQMSLPIFSIGAGVRAASQDKTQAVIQGSARLLNTGDRGLSSMSIRPALIFPASDCSSCDPEYRIAATIDFFQYDILSFYIGGGGAFNKDGRPGNNFGMFSGGVELNIARNFAITGNLNLIDEPSGDEFGGLTWADAETSILFTVRF